MSYKTVETEVEVDLDLWTNKELIEEMRLRGYSVIEGNEVGLDREDCQFLIETIDKMPSNWYTYRIRDKLSNARHK